MESGKVFKKISLGGMDITLRSPKIEDVDNLMANFNALIRARKYVSTEKEQTRDESYKWLSKCIQDIEDGKAVAVVAEISGKVVGMADIHKRSAPRMSHISDFGISVAEEFSGKSIGTELLQTAVSGAEKVLKSRIIMLTVAGPNKPARHLYEKCGFKTVGVVKKGRIYYGEYIDHVLMANYLRKD